MQLEHLSALELGDLVNKKVISPTESIKYFKNRIERRDTINAFTYTKFEEAEKEAEILESRIMNGENVGPLAGVPIALKDFLPSKKGWTHSHGGVKCIADKVDPESSEFTKACEHLGAIAVGKTNAPAFGFRGVTDNFMYGPTSTPFAESYNSGGSSGGSCAAVSRGLVPAAEGGDAGGSIRVPAAWCGCFGFKPSAGIVPSVCRPDAWAATHPYCCGGPVTKSVDDAAVILEHMIRYDARDPISVMIPAALRGFRRYRKQSSEKPLAGLRVAVTYSFDLFPAPKKCIAREIDRIAELLKLGGADVDLAFFHFNYSLPEIEEAWLRGICIDTALDMQLEKGFSLLDHKEQLPEAYVKWNEIALNSSMLDYRKFHEIRTDILDAHNEIFNKYDIILAPVTGCMPVLNSVKSEDGLVQGPTNINGHEVDPLIGFAYTYLENMIGTPAASIPANLATVDNDVQLPVGVQIIAPRYSDAKIFRVSYYLEQANPWAQNYKYSF